MRNMFIDIFEYYVLYKFKNLQEYAIENERYLKTQILNIQNEFENVKEKFGEERAYEYSDKMEANYINYNEEFPNILRKSIIVMICSSFEASLFEICEYLKSNNDYKMSYKDIEGKGIYKAKKYLELVCSVDITKNFNYWMIINQIYEIRNAIIHNKGIIKSINNIKNILENYTDCIEIKEGNEIFVKSEFLLFFINQSVSYIREIFKVLKEK